MTDREPTGVETSIEELLYQPPQSRDELIRRTADVEDADLRRGLVDRIEQGELDDIDAIVAGNTFQVIGLEGARDRLVDIVSSPLPDAADAHERARNAAFIALALSDEFDPETPGEVFDLDPERYADLAASIYSSLFEFTAINLELVYELGDMLLQEPAELRPELFRHLESYRADVGVDAGLLYRPLLEEHQFRELWPALLDAVVDDGVPTDAEWLERAAESLEDDLARQFRKGAMELRTRGLSGSDRPAGFALVGTPDGAGTFPLFVLVEQDEGVYAAHNLVVRHHSRTIREGFFVPNLVTEELDDLTDDIEQTRATVLTEIPVELGLRLARRFIASDDQEPKAYPPETRMAIYRLEHLPDGGAELPDPAAATSVDDEFVRRRFDADDCFESWFFDRTTLESAAILPIPDQGEPTDSWKVSAASRLAEDADIADRIADNFDFLALWYALDGDDRAASQFAAVADDVRSDFASSLAVDLLLDHTIGAVREMQDYAGAFLVEVLGDESLRARLHDYHLDERDDDEAEDQYLNFMELTYRTLEELQSELPPEHRPDPDQMLRAAGPVGRAMANFFGSAPVGPPDDLAETAADALRQAGMDDDIIGVCVPELMTNGRLLAMVRD